MTPITAVGQHGRVTFDGTFVIISRTRLGQSMTGSGEKRFHISNIASINFTPANWLYPGRISFTVPGSFERRGRTNARRGRAAMKDENGLVFKRKAMAEFAALKDAIYAAQAANL